jgi:hypothetical protein
MRALPDNSTNTLYCCARGAAPPVAQAPSRHPEGHQMHVCVHTAREGGQFAAGCVSLWCRARQQMLCCCRRRVVRVCVCVCGCVACVQEGAFVIRAFPTCKAGRSAASCVRAPRAASPRRVRGAGLNGDTATACGHAHEAQTRHHPHITYIHWKHLHATQLRARRKQRTNEHKARVGASLHPADRRATARAVWPAIYTDSHNTHSTLSQCMSQQRCWKARHEAVA